NDDAPELPESVPHSSVKPHGRYRAVPETIVGKGREWEGNGEGREGNARDAPSCHDPNRARKTGDPPRPRSDISARPLQPEQWQPSEAGLAYATELGLTEPEIDQTLVELRDKHGLRPHDVGWWDLRWV